MRNRHIKAVIIGIPLLALLAGQLYLSFFKSREYHSDEFLMDTLVSISTYGTDTDLLQQATQDAFAEMRRLSDLTNRFVVEGSTVERSDVARINEMAGISAVKVNEDVFAMLKAAKEYSVMTNGAFDLTIGPLMDLWGFGSPKQHVPTPEELQKTLGLVDWGKLILDEKNRTVFLAQRGMSLDLGAVAKGYAVEKAALVLQEKGIENALINAGGNIRVLGAKKENQPWKIGIQDPRDSSELLAILNLENGSAVTSGDYNRTFTVENKQYHHIVSPLTGYPAEFNMSVTVITPDSFQGDLLSTALFLLDSEDALRLAESLPDTEAIIVTEENKILVTSGLKDRIEVKQRERYSYDQNR